MSRPRRYHFVSGLPRSGSTLLSALLAQNPRLHAHMTSPVAGLLETLLTEMSAKNEFSVFLTDDKRQRILKSVLESYYADTQADVILDTNRAWCARLPLLSTLWPESRVIACVRDVGAIMNSVEHLVRQNALQPSSIFHYQSGGTVYTRVNGLAGPDGLVGYAYDALKEAFYGTEASRLLLVRYESLARSPEVVLQGIYEFLEEPAYAHDTTCVQFEAEAFDSKAGTPGLHTIRPVVALEKRANHLPPDLIARFAHDAFWQDPRANPHGVRVL